MKIRRHTNVRLIFGYFLMSGRSKFFPMTPRWSVLCRLYGRVRGQPHASTSPALSAFELAHIRGYGGYVLLTIDVSDPTKPRQVGSSRLPGMGCLSLGQWREYVPAENQPRKRNCPDGLVALGI
jgi:hypothetical protein